MRGQTIITFRMSVGEAQELHRQIGDIKGKIGPSLMQVYRLLEARLNLTDAGPDYDGNYPPEKGTLLPREGACWLCAGAGREEGQKTLCGRCRGRGTR